jgi:hypothetical protein
MVQIRCNSCLRKVSSVTPPSLLTSHALEKSYTREVESLLAALSRMDSSHLLKYVEHQRH